MNSEKIEEENIEYNPFEHRQVKKPNSDIRSTANVIKSALGSGLLAGPLAFANAGWGVGIVSTIIIGIICGNCIHILVKTSRGCCKLENKPSLDYAETCKSTFANGPKALRKFATAASIFAEFALMCTYIGLCCIYTILISDSVKQAEKISEKDKFRRKILRPVICIDPLVDRYFPALILPVEYYCLILLIPLCVLCQIRSLRFLAIFSLLANILLIATYLICLYYIFGQEISLADKRVAGDPARYPAFLSAVIFAMEGVGVVMPVENSMKKPQHFLGCPSVLVVAMSTIVFLYATLGLFGYLRYGDVLKGSITLNLPMDDWPAICGKIFIAISIFFTYPLQYYVIMDIVIKHTKSRISEKYRRVTLILARILGVCFCVGVGMALPLLEQIINIVGACFFSILGLMIPAVIETVFRWEDLGKYKWVLWKNIFIAIFSLGCLISGCTVTIMDIIKILHSKTE